MSVVVRMEIPESCFVCPFRLGCSTYRAYSFSTNTRRVLPKPLDEGCNILAVLPEGHGRLMDKDEVIESIRTEVTELFFNGLKGTPRPDGDLRFMWNRLEDEDFAPTIVPAEAERSET